jgi:phospholipid/cholesterol/gamma-HCH transport system substrate-binding protein
MKYGEEVKVGLFVLTAVVLVVLALILVGGMNLLQKPVNLYSMRTEFAGGMEQGAPVRFAGIKVGRVEGTEIDLKDPRRVVVNFSVDKKIPIRADSTARVSSLGLLGEYYVEITPGSPEAALLPSGSEIPVLETVQWTELVNRMGVATEEAKGLLTDVRPRVNATLDNIKDLTGEENRERVRQLLTRMNRILTEAEPRLKTILANFDNTSGKIDKFMDDIKGTREQLDVLLANWSKLTGRDDAEVERTLRQLRDTLSRAEGTMDEVRRLLLANREHLDVTMENFEASSENIRELTDTLKQRPYTLIRVKNPPERQPGEPAPQK